MSLVAAVGLSGQNTDYPNFTKDHVVPYGYPLPRVLTRGEFVSIYGWGLLPKKWCEEPHVLQEPYRREVCGVRVLVGGRPARLMYAGPMGNRYMTADQINFKIPDDAPSDGMVPIQVCLGAICSERVEMEFSSKDILIRVDGKAYVHMPVWIQVEIPMNGRFQYPVTVCPWDFGGYELEIRQNGRILPPDPKPECIHNRTSHAFGSSKLPLHLVHRFDIPGTYEVRLTGPLLTPDLKMVDRIGHSDWIPVIVEPHSETDTDAWFLDIEETVSKPGRWEDAGDLIPSLIGWPDEQALARLLRFLPQPLKPNKIGMYRPPAHMGDVIYCMAPNALAAFPESLLMKEIPAERLEELRNPQFWCP